MARRLATLAAAVLLLTALWAVPALAGGGGGRDAGRCAGFTEGERMLLRDGCLDGIGHFLAEGTDLEVTNDGEMAHDYTAIDGSFGTGLLQPGERATVAAPAAGVYRVYCSLHASVEGHGMAGVLVVGDHSPEAVAAAWGGGEQQGGSGGAPGGASGAGPAALLPLPAAARVAASAAALAAVLAGLLVLTRRRAAARARTSTVATGQGA